MPRRRTGYLIKRGKTYYAAWHVGGKRFVKTTGETTERKALAELNRLMKPFAVGDEVEVLQGVANKIDSLNVELKELDDERNPGLPLLAGWLAYKKADNRPRTGDATMAQYECQYGILCDWIKENYKLVTRMNQVTRDMAREYIAYLEGKGRSPNTVNKYLNLLNLVWRVLAEPGKIEVNPWTKDVITRRRLPSGTGRRELTMPELKKLTEKATGEMRTLLAIGIYTGLRLGDACRLDWTEVDFPKGVIVTTPHKTSNSSGKVVAIPLSPALRRVLEETPEENRSGPILPITAKRYETQQRRVIEEIQNHFEKCGIKTTAKIAGQSHLRVVAGFHSLRHSFITQAALAGWPEALVRAIVGHTSGSVTHRYIHTSVDAVKNLPAMPDPMALPEKGKKGTSEPLSAWAKTRIRELAGKLTSETWEAVKMDLIDMAAE